MPPPFRVVGFARREKTDDSWREELRAALDQFSRTQAGGRRGLARVRPECFLLPGRHHRRGGLPETRGTVDLVRQGAAARKPVVLSRHLAQPVRRGGRAIASRRFAAQERLGLATHRRRKTVRPRPGIRARVEQRTDPFRARAAGLSHRPLSRQGNGAEHFDVPLLELDFRAALEPRFDRPRADHRQRKTRRRASAAAITRKPARCATWCRTTCCKCSRSSPWNRPCRSRPNPSATKK